MNYVLANIGYMVKLKNYTALQKKKIWNTQLMSMIIFYVFLTAESEFDICFSPPRLDFAVHEVEIFAFL